MREGETLQERYELREAAGAGGMAEVWVARDRRLDRDVAVKFLSIHGTEDPDNLVRFFAEAQSIARLQHPNVVTVLDFGAQGDRPYLVMEHVSGGPLTQITGDPLMPERALEIIAGIASAAGAAHAIGIVHRDIKPGNILLDDEGNAKLCDFGIASSARMAERLTATGVAVGSPHYISPEQASGREATPASDVYSLGVVLYELLTGVRPIEAENVTALAIAHVERDPEPPSTHVPDLPPGLDALVLRCLAKDQARRYSDGHDLQRALEAHAAGAPDDVPPWDEDHEPKRPRTRRRVVAAAALAAVAGLVAFRGGLTGEESGARPPAGGGTPTDRPATRTGEKVTDSQVDEDPTMPIPTPTPTASPSETPSDESDADGRADEGPEEGAEEPSPQPSESVTAEPEPTPTAGTDGTPGSWVQAGFGRPR